MVFIYTPEQREELFAAFSLFDKDNDGKIDYHDFGTMMRSLSANPTQA